MSVPTQRATRHDVCPLDDLPVGEGRAYVVGGEQVALFRRRSGKVSAVQATCPHAGGPLADGQIDERVVVCPLHQNAFDLDTGESTTGQPPIAVHPCSVDPDGRVTVEL
ncbi:Rieske (2Fe-2S) protein [Paenibacillus sp. TRM 82003]|uniref:Rieske (2Fe-2S) protein n=1 Tax=Kineococcus sp. TRM81007 TaxID=2925831 RepID=UPI001F5735E0|nr:Rieske (2Fe-2S) protein [Kineococcus sp. TRM81007]MCI2239376.1 Rieske (2Fe-2S) protein [Kineococcus sp. TRM81007]MCI3925058.1 Rieske (2Fe-2S) protein [Paenibacillus sp. TRM 82003]